MNTNLFLNLGNAPIHKVKSETKKLSQEEKEWRATLKAELKKLNNIDEYLYSHEQLSNFWKQKQRIRCLLGMKYETYNPYQ